MFLCGLGWSLCDALTSYPVLAACKTIREECSSLFCCHWSLAEAVFQFLVLYLDASKAAGSG